MNKEIERNILRSYIKDNLLTSNEAVIEMGFTRQYVQQLVREGKLERLKGGTFLKDDIDWFKNQNAISDSKEGL